jgi:Cof subfamily protein (haloacid dehalogenase superfamily)
MPFIIFNGAAAVMGQSKKLLFSSSLDFCYAKQIYETGTERDIPVIMWIAEGKEEKLLANADCPATREYQKISGAELNIIDDLNKYAGSHIAKMMWIDEPDNIKIYREEMSEIFGGKANCYASRPKFLEFVGAETSKGDALQKIGESYGIGKSEMIAIGDSDNDISMLEYAGLGVAMGNASDEVKKVCQRIAPSNNEDGAAKVIEEFIIKENEG